MDKDAVKELTKEQAMESLVDAAVDVLQRHIVPDGLSDHEALTMLYGIFDGPEYRAAKSLKSAGSNGESGWIPVSERLPEADGGEVLVLLAGGSYAVDDWITYREAPVSFSSKTVATGEGWRNWDFEEITHWMPLPAPPSVTSDRKDAGGRNE